MDLLQLYWRQHWQKHWFKIIKMQYMFLDRKFRVTTLSANAVDTTYLNLNSGSVRRAVVPVFSSLAVVNMERKVTLCASLLDMCLDKYPIASPMQFPSIVALTNSSIVLQVRWNYMLPSEMIDPWKTINRF